RLPRHRFDRRSADPADAGRAAHDGEAGADGAGKPRRTLARKKRRLLGGILREHDGRHRQHGDADGCDPDSQPVNLFTFHGHSLRYMPPGERPSPIAIAVTPHGPHPPRTLRAWRLSTFYVPSA